MQSSKKQTMRVYFTPDTINISSKDGREDQLIRSKNQGSTYKLLLMNIDRQKSTTMEINIDDLR